MYQRRLFTYRPDDNLVHTSMWLTDETITWLREISKDTHISQALILNAIVSDFRLRHKAMTTSRFSAQYIDDRYRTDQVLRHFQNSIKY